MNRVIISTLIICMATSLIANHGVAAEPVEQNNVIQATATQVTVASPISKYADPKATFNTYIEAVRRTNPQATVHCWTIDDDNKSGALDAMLGLWVASRRVTQLAELRFGSEGVKLIGGWSRDDVTDHALELTQQRLADSTVTINGDTAELKIKWQSEDGYPNVAFWYGKEAISFRKVNGNWKIDANKMMGLEHAEDYFTKGSWGPMFREQVVLMNRVSDGIEMGEFKSIKQLSVFLEMRIAETMKKYGR